jgi:hypothetical protein
MKPLEAAVEKLGLQFPKLKRRYIFGIDEP